MSGPPAGIPPIFTARPTFLPPFGPPNGSPRPSGSSTQYSSTSTASSVITSAQSNSGAPSSTSSNSPPTTQPSLPVSDPTQQSHKSSIIGPIVGGVIGALVLLLLLLAWRGIVWVRRRKRQRLEEKGPRSPIRQTDIEAAPSTPGLHSSVTPYSYNPSGDIVSATTLTGSTAPPWSKKTASYGVDSVLVAHNGVDAETRSLARSASLWTADTKHTSTSMGTALMSPSSPGGISVSTSEHSPSPILRVDPTSRISQNKLPLEVVPERPVVGEDIPPPYERNVT